MAKQPKSFGAHTALGVILQVQNRRDEARAHYESALAANPRSAVSANNLAWMMAEDGLELDRALALAQSAKAELPDAHEISDTLGWVYFKKGLHGPAVTAFRESVEKSPNTAIYHFHLGLAYASSGDAARAKEALWLALTLKLPPQ